MQQHSLRRLVQLTAHEQVLVPYGVDYALLNLLDDIVQAGNVLPVDLESSAKYRLIPYYTTGTPDCTCQVSTTTAD